MGKIKKILEKELGSTQSVEIYPVTSIKAVYDESNERLDNIIRRKGVVNISTNYNSDHIAEVLTLSQALGKVPVTDRVLGFQGKYLASDGWHTIIYTGESVANWGVQSLWIDLPDKIFNNISKNAMFVGVATPTTNPGTPDGLVFYIANGKGTYNNFGGIDVTEDEVVVLYWDTAWRKVSTGIASHNKLSELEKKEGVINTVKYSDTGRFESLAEVLAAIPLSDRLEHAMIYYLDNSFNYHIYIFISTNIDDVTWNTLNYWREVPIINNIADINNALSEIPTIKESIIDANSNIAKLDTKTNDVTKAYSSLNTKKAIFNGSTSFAKWDRIALKDEGDFVEIEFSGLVERIGNDIFSAIQSYNQSVISIAISNNSFALRTYKDGSEPWIVTIKQLEVSDAKTVRIEYKNGNILSYVDETLIDTYSGQDVKVYLSGAGKNILFPYWKGEIGLVKIHTASLDFNGYIDKLPGYTATDVVIESSTSDSFLNTEQSNTLAKVPTLENNISSINTEISEIQKLLNGLKILPNCVVSTISDNRVNVYFKLSQNTYGMLTIWHMVTDEEGQYKWRNLWGIYSDGGLYSYDGTSFTYLNKKLLIGAENEFAMRLEGMGDFTGGYHGYERIDKDTSCYNVFLVDGQEQTFEQLVAKGTFACDEFGYRQRSQMFTGFAYPTPKIRFADHVKTTIFKNGGFTSRNYIEFDLSALSIENLLATTSFTGLVCVHEDCASKVVGDDGSIYNAVHPTATVSLVNSINKASLKVTTSKDNFSCEVNSKVVGTNIEVYKNAQPNVQIMDRADDCKYYSYLPANTNVKTGDYFETEVSVKWKYNSMVM